MCSNCWDLLAFSYDVFIIWMCVMDSKFLKIQKITDCRCSLMYVTTIFSTIGHKLSNVQQCNYKWQLNQTSRLDIKIDKYILLFLFFVFQSLKSCVHTVWQSNYTLHNYAIFIHRHVNTLNLIGYCKHYWLCHTSIFSIVLILRVKATYKMCHIIKQLMTFNSMDTRIY
jgi:uncharacterized membrane protein